MAKINFVKKSRKEHKCSKTGVIIPVGSPYQWISFNFGPTIVRSMEAGFEPWELISNEYSREIARIQQEFSKRIDELDTIEDAEALKDELQGALESMRDEQEEKRDNLPEQFQDVGPGEVITERYDNLEEVISNLEDISFDDFEEREEDLEEIKEKMVELYDDETKDWDEDTYRAKYTTWYEEEIIPEALDEIRTALDEALDNLEG